ncbi:MAG: hypothetical protein NZM04_00935 [Methylacidiphilales bacterium]|nr:hypothetical protein [Candidatus Methylacidiphilales bacterium]MDW8350204.1 hypothetical protein [Verrucomicrobiae bacterium]
MTTLSLEPLDDIARLRSARILWKNPTWRARLTAHWTDPRHPYRERFLAQKQIIEFALSSPLPEPLLDTQLRTLGHTLRTIRREIPPIFGHFFHETKTTQPPHLNPQHQTPTHHEPTHP